MIKVIVDDQTFFYDSAADVYNDYPEAVYINGYFIANEERSEEQ